MSLTKIKRLCRIRCLSRLRTCNVDHFAYNRRRELASFGPWTYAYDALSRLVAAYSNGTLVVSNRYDHLGRRVHKIAPDGTHTFLYDGWRPVEETVARASGGADRIEYHWGKDLSGTLDGAAGVGGLLYVKRNGATYVPFYDAFGNVMGYWDEQGNVVAGYVYDAFGRTVAKNGTMADVFSIRYSTKYYDTETGMYYYGKRYYLTALCRWLTRDPIEEDDNANLYLFVGNAAPHSFDQLGNERMTLKYDAIQPSIKDRILNWATTYDMSLSQIGVDILSKVAPYSKKGKGKCKCVEHFLLAGHGSQGQLIITPQGGFVNSRDVNLMRVGVESDYLPAGAFSLFKIVKEKMCDRGTVEFVTCYSGAGIQGEKLRNSLKRYFGNGINVVLYRTSVKYYYNQAL